MITVKIGGDERQWSGPSAVEEGWIAQQIARRRTAGEFVCVRVGITTSGVSVALATPGCPSGGSARRPTKEEERVFDLWATRGLNDPSFGPGNLVAFLKQLERLL